MSTNKCVVRKLKDSFFNNLISAENVSDSICLFYGYPPPAHFMSKSIIYLLYVSLIYLLCPTGTTVDNYRPNISCLRRYLTVFVRLLFTAWGNFCACQGVLPCAKHNKGCFFACPVVTYFLAFAVKAHRKSVHIY